MSNEPVKTAYVTGGTGFLGYNLILELLAAGWDVIALHRKESDVSRLKDLKVKLVEGDIKSFASIIVRLPEKVDAIFHAAANTSTWEKEYEDQWIDNVEGTKNMVNAALQRKAKRFIYTSSLASFGYHIRPVTETSRSLVYENGTHYGITKFEAEKIVKDAVSKGLDPVILNPAHILGPYDKHNWIQLFTLINQNKLPGIPPGRGMFCHVRDVARAHIAAFYRGETGQHYMLGGTEASFKDVINKIEGLLGKKQTKKVTPKWMLDLVATLHGWRYNLTGTPPDVTPDKVKMVTMPEICSNRRAIEELNFNISPIDEILNDCYQWLQKEGEFEDRE